VAHSIKLRMVLVFLVLAAAMTFVMVTGAQKAFSVGWREAARPLLMDYVDRLAGEITAGGLPSVERAQAITRRLPLTVRIDGSAGAMGFAPRSGCARLAALQGGPDEQRFRREDWGGGKDWQRILKRQTSRWPQHRVRDQRRGVRRPSRT
jgi:hypothetical protein